MKELTEFNKFIISQSFNKFIIEEIESFDALQAVVRDVNIHFNQSNSESEILNRITSNQPELAIYIYRLGRSIFLKDNNDKRISILHGLMRYFCSCEIYFNTKIDVGFYINHGLGAIIGSRQTIGKNFRIHQNCTIGHKKNGLGEKSGNGAIIGDNVIMYANSSIIGEITIGDNVIIGLNQQVYKNVQSNSFIK